MWLKKYPVCHPEWHNQQEYVNPYLFMDALAKLTKKGAIIITDAGATLNWTMQGYRMKEKQKLYSAFNHSPMGYALPASLGAQFACRDKQVVCISGDGGMVMNNWFSQFLSDVVNVGVLRPKVQETTALGAAFMAGLQIGVYKSLGDISKNWALDKKFSPKMKNSNRTKLLKGCSLYKLASLSSACRGQLLSSRSLIFSFHRHFCLYNMINSMNFKQLSNKAESPPIYSTQYPYN